MKECKAVKDGKIFEAEFSSFSGLFLRKWLEIADFWDSTRQTDNNQFYLNQADFIQFLG